MTKIIFLNMDGVIAIPEEQSNTFAIGKTPINNLDLILKKTGAKIVLTSSWRMNTLEDTIKYMKEEGFKFADEIIGITIRAYQHIEKGFHMEIPRGVEIKQWIDTNIHSNNGKDYERKKLGIDYTYVILDDERDMLLEQKDNFIWTNKDEGLTFEDAFKAIHILNNYDSLYNKGENRTVIIPEFI